MRIANNVIALNVANNMSKADRKVALSMGRLSSGLKINKAKDNSAGYAISRRLNMQNQGYVRGSENALDGISLLETAEASLDAVHELLQRARELSVQAATDTLSDDDRRLINNEIDGYVKEIDKISKGRSFNGIEFLNGHAQRMTLESDPDVSEVSYVSESLPDGALKYTITSLGTPAEYTTSYDTTSTATKNGTIYINDSEISILASDSASDIYDKIMQSCDDTNLTFDDATGTFTATEAGSKNTISITGDPTILADLGLTGSLTAGTDAVITIDSYTKADGTVDTTYNPSIASDGNEITLTSPNGGVIEIQINPVNPKTGATTTTPSTQTSEITNRGYLNLQLGGTANAVLNVYIPKINAETLDLDYVNVSTREGANTAIGLFEDAITKVSTIRSTIGAYVNRLTYTEQSLNVASNSTTVSLSRLQDTDMAKEMALYTQNNVIFQAGTSILAQANQRPQIILQLIN